MGSDNGNKGGKIAAHGLPDMSADEKKGGSAIKTGLTVLVILVIGALLALGMVRSEVLELINRAKLTTVLSNDLHFLFLAAVIFGRCVAFLNFFPMAYKGLILRGKSGNLRANMQFYKLLNEENVSSYVGLEEDGDVGKYNRANRSLMHFVENSLSVVLNLLLAGVVFPRAVCALTLLFAAGRVLHQTGYSAGGYGSHGLGFLLATVASGMLEGIVFLVALKGFGFAYGL